VALEEKEHLLTEVEKERGLWRQRDGAFAALLQEKEDLIQNLQQQLEVGQTDVEVISRLFLIQMREQKKKASQTRKLHSLFSWPHWRNVLEDDSV